MASRTFRIVISSRNGGGILVERQEQFGAQWKTIDRYNTHDLTAELKRTDPWIAEVISLCSQASAGVEILVPPTPRLEPSQAERLNEYEQSARHLEMQAQHDAEFRLPQIPSKTAFRKMYEGSWDTTEDKQKFMLEKDASTHVYVNAEGNFVKPLKTDHAERYEL